MEREEFKWGDDSTLVHRTLGVAVYLNPDDEVVIRHESGHADYPDDAVVITADEAERIAHAILKLIGKS